MKRIILSLIATMFCLQAFSQIVNVGNGTDTCHVLPFNLNNSTHYSQQIILASEIDADSNLRFITDIGFTEVKLYYYQTTLVNMTIMMGNTSSNSLSQGYLPHSQMNEVFSSSMSFMQIEGNRYKIHLGTPFEWDRTSNIVLTFIKNPGSSGPAIQGLFCETKTDSLSKYHIGNSSYSLENPPNEGTLTNQRVNFQLYMVSCLEPDSIQYLDILPNSVNVNWKRTGDASNWEVQYKIQSDTSWINANSVFTTDTNLTINNLLDKTNYDLRIRTICGEFNKSEWTESEFRTICHVITDFPYYEDFSSEQCWNPLQNVELGYFNQYDNTYVASLDAFYFPSFFVSPALGVNIDSLKISFEATNSYGTLSIGVMDTSMDISSFQSLLDITNPIGFYETHLNSSPLVGANNYIALRHVGGAVWIKNLIIDYISIGQSINNLEAHTVSPTEISLNWSEYNSLGNGYQIAYNIGDSLDLNIATIINLNNTTSLPYIIGNLLPSTKYSIGVRQNGEVDFSVKNEKTYSLPAQIPYNCDFEDSVSANSWTFSNNDYLYLEIDEALDSTNNHMLSIRKRDSVNDLHTTVVASRLIQSSGAGGYKLSFKTKVISSLWGGSTSLKVYMVDEDSSYFGSNNKVYYSGSNFPTSINNNFIQLINNENYSFDLPYMGEIGTNKKIFFVFYSTLLEGEYVGLDDVQIEERQCVSPVLNTDPIITNNVSLSWIRGINDNAWWLYSKKSLDTSYDSIYITDTNSFILTNLEQSTLYKAYIVLDCDSNTYSDISNIIEFRAGCKLIDSLPFIENFESYPSSYNSYMTCWLKMVKTNVFYSPFITNYENSKSLYFSSSRYGRSNAITPQLDSNIPISSTMLRLKIKTIFPSTYLTIGAISDVNDFNSFDSITTIAPDTVQTWQRFEVKLNNYTGSGDRIVLRAGDSVNTFYLYLDEFSINTYHPCSDVVNFSIDSINRSPLRVSWDVFNSSNQGYQISYQKQDSISYPNAETIITINDSIISFPYTIRNLEGFTNYRIGVRQNCGGPWTYLNIKTEASGVDLPYFCDFSDSTERASWVVSNGNAPNKWVIGQGVNSNPIGGHSLYISNDNGLTNTYTGGNSPLKPSTSVASRLFNSTGSTGYILTFDSRMGGEALYDFLKVYVVDEDTVFNGSNSSPYFGARDYSVGNVLYGGNNGANPTYPYFCNPSNPDSINNHIINIPYIGQDGVVKKLVFVWNNDAFDYNQPPASIDNISLTVNYCSTPELIINSINHISADISWNKHPDDSSWYLYYKELSAINYDSIHIINDTNYILNNLSPSTTYNLYFRKDCGTSLSDPRDTISFSTPCNPITQLPFYEDFEIQNGSNYVDCWRMINTLSNYPPRIYSSGYQSSNCLRLSVHAPNTSLGANSTIGTYAILPILDTSIHLNNLLIRFMMKSGYHNGIVGLLSDVNDESTFDSIATFSTTGDNWEEKVVYFNNYLGNGRNIAFKALNESYGSQYGYVDLDNVYVDEISNCIIPTNLTVTNITTDSADLSWTTPAIPSPSYWLFYKKVNDNVFDSIFTTSMTYSLSGLDHSTLYKFYVRASCTSGVSENSDTIGFRTQCSAMNLFPYVEDFENYLSYDIKTPYCWNYNFPIYPPGYSPIILFVKEDSNTYLNTYNFVSNFYLATPEIDEDINLLKLSLLAKSQNANTNLLIGIMSNVSDSSTFELVSSIPLTANLTEYEVYFNEATISGTNNYIAFKMSSVYPSGFILDDIIIDYIPDCSRPSNVNIDNITSTEAEIDITSFNNNATSWWLFYKKDIDATYDSVYVTNLPYILSGLDPICRYQVYAKNECGQEISTKSNVVEFWTSCYEIASIPHSENFDINYPWDYYVNVFNKYPPCWTTNNNNKPFIHTISGNCFLRFMISPSNYNDYKIAITPRFDSNISISSLKLSFDYKNYANHVDDIVVGVISNPDDLSTFDSISSFIPLTYNTWYNGVVDFSTYTGNGQYVAFLVKSRAHYRGNVMDIDNLLLEYNSSYPLPAPINLSITNITDSSAYFSWQKGGTETLWEVTKDTTITPIQVTDTSYMFDNLIGSTSYTAYVRGVDYAISPWVATNFTTLVTIVEGEVETLDASDITDTSAVLNGVLASNGNAINNIEMGFLLHNEPQINLLSQGVVKIPISYRDSITTFNYNITNLPSDSTFYYTTYFSNIAGDVYGTVKHFSTLTLSEDIIKEDLTINIFPNPTNNISVLRINNLKEKAIVSIYDLQGRQIKTYDIEANQQELTLNLKDYSSGMYYVKLKTRTINKAIKLIVNR